MPLKALAPAPFMLKVGDDGALLVPPQGREPSAPVFAEHNDNVQIGAILEKLSASPRAPVIIVADTLAQDYRRDALPRVNALDRRKLVSRRLLDYFPAHAPSRKPITAAVALKKKETLFVCLHNEGELASWLERLSRCPNLFLGVVPMPLAAAYMLPKLQPTAGQGWHILLSYQRTGGFRQIVTHNGSFVFTRLTPPVAQKFSPSFVTASLAVDLQATVDYLSRLGLSNGATLDMAAILPREMHKVIATLPDPVKVSATFTPREAAERLGLSLAPSNDDSASDELFASWVAKHRALRPLMLPAAERKELRTMRVQKWGMGAAAAIGLLALVNLGWQGIDLLQLAKANRTAAHNVAILKEQWRQERADLAPVTEPLGRLRQAVARQRLFNEPLDGPWPLLQTIARNIRASDRLTKFAWNCGAKNGGAESLSFSLRMTGNAPPNVQGDDDRQNVVRYVDELAQTLRAALPDYEIAVMRYPFLVKPDDSLTNAGDNPDAAAMPTADFSLRKATP